jgi:outer membrane protein assembly factor BamD
MYFQSRQLPNGRPRASHLVLLGLLGLTGLAAGACRHGSAVDIATLAAGNDRTLWESGNKALKKQQYTSARQYYSRLIEGFPTSSFQPLARLARADSYFQERGTENYILAANEYREFLSVYPSHPKADYAQFQVVQCFFKQKLGPDRDQTNTIKALEEGERFLTMFASSPYADQVRDVTKRCRWSLARSEQLVGQFYQRRGSCRAAIQRFEALLKDYSDYTGTDEVLLRFAQCLTKVGRGAEAVPLLSRLVENYPKSPFRLPAERLLRLAQASPVPTPSPAPSPAQK